MDKFPKLAELFLNNNALTGEVPSSVGELVNLEFLRLYDNALSGNFLEQPFLENMTALTNIDLGDNLFSGAFSKLGQLTNLWFVNLSGNRLTGSIPTEIVQLPLSNLALNHNELTGTFPTELALLSDICM